MGEEDVTHHRYRIVLELSGEMQETKTRSEEAAPPDDGVKTKIKARLEGLDLGSDFKITKISVDRYTKTVM